MFFDDPGSCEATIFVKNRKECLSNRLFKIPTKLKSKKRSQRPWQHQTATFRSSDYDDATPAFHFYGTWRTNPYELPFKQSQGQTNLISSCREMFSKHNTENLQQIRSSQPKLQSKQEANVTSYIISTAQISHLLPLSPRNFSETLRSDLICVQECAGYLITNSNTQ